MGKIVDNDQCGSPAALPSHTSPPPRKSGSHLKSTRKNSVAQPGSSPPPDMPSLRSLALLLAYGALLAFVLVLRGRRAAEPAGAGPLSGRNKRNSTPRRTVGPPTLEHASHVDHVDPVEPADLPEGAEVIPPLQKFEKRFRVSGERVHMHLHSVNAL